MVIRSHHLQQSEADAVSEFYTEELDAQEVERLRIELIAYCRRRAAYCRRRAEEKRLLAEQALEQGALMIQLGALCIEVSGLLRQYADLSRDIDGENTLASPELLEIHSIIKEYSTSIDSEEPYTYTAHREQVIKSIRTYLLTYLESKGDKEKAVLIWQEEKKKFSSK